MWLINTFAVKNEASWHLQRLFQMVAPLWPNASLKGNPRAYIFCFQSRKLVRKICSILHSMRQFLMSQICFPHFFSQYLLSTINK